MSYVEIWDPNEVLNLASKGALLVDVRAKEAYDKEHIRGAINIPLDNLDSHLENLPKDKPVVVYCGSVDCTMSYFAARKLAGKDVGALLLTPLDEDKAVVRGAVLEPTPLLLRRQVVDVQPPIDDYIAKNIGALMGKATHVEIGEADKAIREIKALIEVVRKPPVSMVEEEEY